MASSNDHDLKNNKKQSIDNKKPVLHHTYSNWKKSKCQPDAQRDIEVTKKDIELNDTNSKAFIKGMTLDQYLNVKSRKGKARARPILTPSQQNKRSQQNFDIMQCDQQKQSDATHSKKLQCKIIQQEQQVQTPEFYKKDNKLKPMQDKIIQKYKNRRRRFDSCLYSPEKNKNQKEKENKVDSTNFNASFYIRKVNHSHSPFIDKQKKNINRFPTMGNSDSSNVLETRIISEPPQQKILEKVIIDNPARIISVPNKPQQTFNDFYKRKGEEQKKIEQKIKANRQRVNQLKQNQKAMIKKYANKFQVNNSLTHSNNPLIRKTSKSIILILIIIIYLLMKFIHTLSIGILFASFVLGIWYYLYRIRDFHRGYPDQEDWKLEPMTLEQLGQYDGVQRPQIYLAIFNIVFDVTNSGFYGKNQTYYQLGAVDATINLAKWDTDTKYSNKYNTNQYNKLSTKQKESIEKSYRRTYCKKYKKVARIVINQQI